MTARLWIALTLLSIVAFAQEPKRKPGLWELTVALDAGGLGIPQDRLAQMTPEQRTQIEALMKARGARMMQPSVTKTCETPDTLKSEASMLQTGDNTCKVNTISSTGTQRVVNLSCDGPNGKSDGTATFDTPDPGQFSGTIKMHVNRGGSMVNVTEKVSGKWLGSDCGSVKPRSVSK